MFKKILLACFIIYLNGQIISTANPRGIVSRDIYSNGDYEIFSDTKEFSQLNLDDKDINAHYNFFKTKEGASLFALGITNDLKVVDGAYAKPLAKYRSINKKNNPSFFIFYKTDNTFQILAVKYDRNLTKTRVICSTEQHNDFKVIFNSFECQNAFKNYGIDTKINELETIK